jgi:hypothetical protein
MKIGCLISQITLSDNAEDLWNGKDQSRYTPLVKCAVDSFKVFHPDVDMHYVNDNNFFEYCEKYVTNYELVNHIGILRYMLAYELMEYFKYDKIIILGGDTITCSRMDEFLNDNISDILATLNYPNQDSTQYWATPIFDININGNIVQDSGNINADVVCFNNKEALKKVIELSIEHYTLFAEQGALNELAWVDKSYSVKIVDFPYPTSNVVYNARSKGVFGTDMIKKGVLVKHGPLDGQLAPTRKFYVKDKKLYTQDHKHIKCFHYVEGLGGRTDEEFNEMVNDFRSNWFNKETINFFKEECGCSEFFSYIK